MIILWLLKLGTTMLIHNKDDIQFVTEFPCFLGHPVYLKNIPQIDTGLPTKDETLQTTKQNFFCILLST